MDMWNHVDYSSHENPNLRELRTNNVALPCLYCDEAVVEKSVRQNIFRVHPDRAAEVSPSSPKLIPIDIGFGY